MRRRYCEVHQISWFSPRGRTASDERIADWRLRFDAGGMSDQVQYRVGLAVSMARSFTVAEAQVPQH